MRQTKWIFHCQKENEIAPDNKWKQVEFCLRVPLQRLLLSTIIRWRLVPFYSASRRMPFPLRHRIQFKGKWRRLLGPKTQRWRQSINVQKTLTAFTFFLRRKFGNKRKFPESDPASWRVSSRELDASTLHIQLWSCVPAEIFTLIWST